MKKNKVYRTLFLNPFRDSAVPMGNTNVVNSIDKRFKPFLFKVKSYELEINKKARMIRVSDSIPARALQILLKGLPLAKKTDLIIGNGNIIESMFIFFAKLLNPKIKYIFFLHTCYERYKIVWRGSLKATLLNRMNYHSYKYLLKKADSVIAISDFVKSGFVRNRIVKPEKIFVVINSVDNKFFNLKKRDVKWLKKFYGIKNNKKNVLYLSKLSKSKRAYLLPKIAEQLPEYNFIIQGKNHLGIDFSKNKNVYFSEERPPRKVIPKIFASSDLFVFPSEVEPCGAVVTEAMASGLPIVASKGGAVPEQIIDKVNGYAIPIQKGEIKEFAKAIRNILSSSERWKKFSAASRKRALGLDRKEQGKKYDSIFLKTLEKH